MARGAGRRWDRAVRVGVLALGLLAVACQTPLRPTTDYDASVDFARFETFTWIAPNPLVRVATQRPLSPLVVERVMGTTRDAFERRGLRFVEDPEQADLAVAFTIGSREQIRTTSYPTHIRRGRRGPHVWHSAGSFSVQSHSYTEGQLAIDLFDIAAARPVWHGTVSRRITQRDRDAPDEILAAAVEAIVEEFPPR